MSILESTLPFTEKYRPTYLDDIITNNNNIQNLSKMIDNEKLPHLLFYGPAGTGKTSTVMACARKLYGDNYRSMVLELNGSDDRGINTVRQEIKEFASTNKMFRDGVKLVILDEVDSMTYDAQFALRRVIEKFTYNTRFCLICNFVNKIIDALQSRCIKFKFSPLDTLSITNRLKTICDKENIECKDKTLKTIVKLSDGDLRKSINILQSVSISYNDIKSNNVYDVTGYPDVKNMKIIYKSLFKDNFITCYNKILNIKIKKGLLLNDIIKEITYLLINDKKINSIKKMKLMCAISKIETSMTYISNNDLYLGGLISAFILNK